jgi:hypothetical protein
VGGAGRGRVLHPRAVRRLRTDLIGTTAAPPPRGVIAEGPPEKIVTIAGSHTGEYLKHKLEPKAPSPRAPKRPRVAVPA